MWFQKKRKRKRKSDTTKRSSKKRRKNKENKKEAEHLQNEEIIAMETVEEKSIEWEPDDEFEVEEILDEKRENDKSFYYLKWKNFSPKYNTWEPEDNINKSFIDAWKTQKILNELIEIN